MMKSYNSKERKDIMIKLKYRWMTIFVVILAALVLFPGFAQSSENDASEVLQAPDSPEKEKEIIYRDWLRRDTPQGTTEGMISALRARDYALAAQYFDLQNIPEKEREEQGALLARQLRIVLDQNIRIDLANIDNTYDGRKDDGLLASQEVIGVITMDQETHDLLLERKQVSDDLNIWELSEQTVQAIPEMYDYFGLGVLGKHLPENLFEYEFLGITAAEWLSIIALVLGLFVVTYIPTQLLYLLVKRLKMVVAQQFLHSLLWPVRWIIIITAANSIFQDISFSVTARAVTKAKTLVIVSAIWLLLRLFGFFFMRWRRVLNDTGHEEKAVLVALAQKIFSTLLVLIGAALYLENLGLKITTIVTGLGVGGVAVALAAQKSIEDIFGAVTILSSSPIKVGDFISLDGRLGTVEEIGLRFTKIRTLERTLLNIPNSKIAGMNLDNLSRRDKFLYNPDIGVRLDTTADQVRYVMLKIREMFYSHPGVHVLPARIRLKEFNAYAIVMSIFLYIKADDYDESLAVAEDLNFRIKAILEECGVDMAYPSQTIYREQGVLPDPKLAEKINDELKQIEKDGKLFAHHFPYEEIKKLRGAIKYPPDTGSDKT
jgi:MscS family membrane protein